MRNQIIDSTERALHAVTALRYPLGFFVNVGSPNDHLEHYKGRYADRLVGIAIWVEGQEIKYQICLIYPPDRVTEENRGHFHLWNIC